MHEHRAVRQILPGRRVEEAVQRLLALLGRRVLPTAIGREEDDARLLRAARQLQDALEYRRVLLEAAARDDQAARALQPARPLVLGIERRGS